MVLLQNLAESFVPRPSITKGDFNPNLSEFVKLTSPFTDTVAQHTKTKSIFWQCIPQTLLLTELEAGLSKLCLFWSESYSSCCLQQSVQASAGSKVPTMPVPVLCLSGKQSSHLLHELLVCCVCSYTQEHVFWEQTSVLWVRWSFFLPWFEIYRHSI